MGIQAPGGKIYSPNFIEAIEAPRRKQRGIFDCKEFCQFFDPLAFPAASSGECARCSVQKVKEHTELKDIFSYFKMPWLFCDTVEEYSNLFKNAGFTITFAEIKPIATPYVTAKVFDIFKSGASAGYLNQKYYNIPINEDYQRQFLATIEQSFKEQAKNGIINLIFNRIFLVAGKQ